jgi:ABC-type thiamine transport system ATPase subunit
LILRSLKAAGDVSIAMQTGELRAVISATGAAKTTFFNLISEFLLGLRQLMEKENRSRPRCCSPQGWQTLWGAE